MGGMTPWLHAVSAAAAGALVMGVVEGLALTACVAVVLRLCPGVSAGMRSAVWTTALGMSVLLPVASLWMARGAADTPHRVAEVSEIWALGVVAIWAVLSVVRLAMLAVSAARMRRIWRRATPIVAGAGWGALLRGGRRSAELCVSEDVDRPSVVGFFRPRVLLPAALREELGPEEMEHVVRHEMEHLQRRDDWTNLLQKLSMALFPLNPVLFWLDRRLCEERELACDDGVLRETRARKAYATCLTNLAMNRALSRLGQRGSGLVLGAFGRESELARRVQRILSWREESGIGKPAVAAVLMLSVAAGALEMARCPQLLRFTGSTANVADVSARLLVPGAAGLALSMEPVVASASRSATAGPMLLRAVMPEGRTAGAPGRRAGRRHRLSRSVAGVGRAQPWPLRRRAAMEVVSPVVLTAWPERQVPAQLVFTVADDGRPRYAAFATRDGWLFVSL